VPKKTWLSLTPQRTKHDIITAKPTTCKPLLKHHQCLIVKSLSSPAAMCKVVYLKRQYKTSNIR